MIHPTSVHIQIDPAIGKPLNRQIADQFVDAITSDVLHDGVALPSVRQLSKKLGVSTVTVVSAYGLLVNDGLVTSTPRSGYRVAKKSVMPERGFNEVTAKMLRLDKIVPYLPICPVAEFGKLLAEVSCHDEAGGYTEGRGYTPLIEEIVKHANAKNIRCKADNIVTTAGTQQALHLVSRLIKPGDKVLVEEPAYPGALRVFEAAGAQLLPVPMTHEGVDLDTVGQYLRNGRVRLMYTCPTFHNPTGYSYTRAVKRELLDIAEKNSFRIFEDDYLGDIVPWSETNPTMKSMDVTGRVIYSFTFSKCLLPGLRLAYTVAEPDVIERLSRQRTQVDICGSSYLERALWLYLARDRYASHLVNMRSHYLQVREEMRRAGFQAQGLCSMDALPGGLSADKFTVECAKLGLAISPGSHYYTSPSKGHSSYRLAFSSLAVGDIAQITEKLNVALEKTGIESETVVI